MNKAFRPPITLLLLAPICGELLSSSSPPVEFFHPLALALQIALYGCGVLRMRDLAWLRWRISRRRILPA